MEVGSQSLLSLIYFLCLFQDHDQIGERKKKEKKKILERSFLLFYFVWGRRRTRMDGLLTCLLVCPPARVGVFKHFLAGSELAATFSKVCMDEFLI